MYTGIMIRLALAILLTLFSLAAPARAICAFDSIMQEPAACCCVQDSDCATLSGTCCEPPARTPALPSQSQQQFSAVALVGTIEATVPTAETAFEPGITIAQPKPLHLASNKIYLLKRSLLI